MIGKVLKDYFAYSVVESPAFVPWRTRVLLAVVVILLNCQDIFVHSIIIILYVLLRHLFDEIMYLSLDINTSSEYCCTGLWVLVQWW